MISAPAFIAFLILMTAVPYAVIGRHRLRYAVLDVASYGFCAGLRLLGPLVGLTLDDSLWFAAFVVIKVALFFAFLSWTAVPWTANRAALFAGALYLALIPHVLQWPIDGDEPFYLLVTESLVGDQDLDLRNQYADLASSETRREDLRPQLGDPVGRRGEQYSRTEPFLSLLLIPGYLLFGLGGSVATIALFGGLLVRSTMRLLEEEGSSPRAQRICAAFLTAGPPIVFYATRIWPEVPAGYFFVEALRGFRRDRPARLLLNLLALSLLKLRFLLIAVVLLVMFIRRASARWQTMAAGAALLLLPLVAVFLATGEWLNVHEPWELRPAAAWKYARGAMGLLLDAQGGLLFQAPFYVLGLAAALRWRSFPLGARAGLGCSVLYLLLLVPRDEWHGGWAPPLRYVVVLMPVLCIAASSLLERLRSAALMVVAIATAVLTVHGIAFPWRLFHIASGESILGELLSVRFDSDFSRMFPSFLRPNTAAVVASLIVAFCVVCSFLWMRFWPRIAVPPQVMAAAAALLLAGWFQYGMRPARLVHLEDAHVAHQGGELYPGQWTVARFRFSGGWTIRTGDSLHFQYDGGDSWLFYAAVAPASVSIDGRPVALASTGGGLREVRVNLDRSDRHSIRGLAGEVTIDRIEQR